MYTIINKTGWSQEIPLILLNIFEILEIVKKIWKSLAFSQFFKTILMIRKSNITKISLEFLW